jgi:hypothetical protein
VQSKSVQLPNSLAVTGCGDDVAFRPVVALVEHMSRGEGEIQNPRLVGNTTRTV